MTSSTTITVGQLPEWYNEEKHDFALEEMLGSFAGEGLDVEYVYNGKHIKRVWNDNGDLIEETEITIDFDSIRYTVPDM